MIISRYNENYYNLDEVDNLLEKAFCEGYEYAQKEYSRYDDVDALRRAVDSDILDEEEQESPGYGKAALSSLAGGATGSLVGSALAAILSKGDKIAAAKKGAKLGFILGGLGSMSGALKKRQKKVDDVEFYNSRLRYARRQAKRRERKDWKYNMTTGRNEQGYTY